MKTGNLILKNASEVITCSGCCAKKGSAMGDIGRLTDAAVVIENGLITAVGPSSEVLTDIDENRFEVIDADGKAALPGFVDSHTHFVFGGYRAEEFALRLQGASYMEIMARGGGILRTVADTRNASLEQLVKSGRRRLDAMLAFGVTTVEGKSGYGLDSATELRQLEAMTRLDKKHPIDIVRTFLGAHAIPETYKEEPDAYLDIISESVLPEVADRGLADFCDIFCEEGVFSVPQSRRLLTRAQELGLQLTLHADEIVTLGGAELAAELRTISADHLLHASEKGIKALAAAGVVATLLPLTAFSLKEPYAKARYMIDQSCAVALATDFNPGSCFSESIPLLAALATIYMGMSPEEVISALTINGAAAVGRQRIVGSLDVGKKGDTVILEYPSYQFIPYHIGVNTVEKVIKAGQLVYDKTQGGILNYR
jgi:imidazolonepropionase